MRPTKIIFHRTIILFAAFCFVILVIYNFSTEQREQQFAFLADSFLHGKTYFLQDLSVLNPKSGWRDASLYNGHYYWPLGIFPVLVMIPFVAIAGVGFSQAPVSVLLTFISAALVYLIALHIIKKRRAAVVIAFAYIFSTAYVGVALTPFCWHFAHVVATCCLLTSIYFTLVKPKSFLAGLFFSFAFLTRISIILGIVFYLLYFLTLDKKQAARKILLFLTPVILGLGIFFTYNYVRFGNILDTGYRYQILVHELVANREVGMWSILHFPSNLYLFLFKGPDVIMRKGTFMVSQMGSSQMGMSFIFTSPVLLYLALVDIREKINIYALAAAGAMALFLFGTYGLGLYQYGYRFALDFQPFLLLALADVFKKNGLGVRTEILVVASCAFNLCLFSGLFP